MSYSLYRSQIPKGLAKQAKSRGECSWQFPWLATSLVAALLPFIILARTLLRILRVRGMKVITCHFHGMCLNEGKDTRGFPESSRDWEFHTFIKHHHVHLYKLETPQGTSSTLPSCLCCSTYYY